MTAHHCLHVWPWTKRPAQRLLLPKWQAITIGRHIISWRPLNDVDLAHELKHVEQWRHHGMRFIVRYLRAGRAAARRGGHRYRDNPFEVEARAAEQAVRQHSGGHTTPAGP
ncbi:MAG: hypothetical protein H0X20_01450, partial [Chloroflexi bacterium]|nr:hypothetical protein [Chloroflexota bacterium]